MTAQDIRNLLEDRHSKDLVVHECPTRSAYEDGYGQIDTWVLRKSWTRAAVIGYEIKVTRSDFLNDQKWMAYLPCCNEFYFAVAPGVCDVSEVPEGVGLLVAAKTGTRIFTKRKAAFRIDGTDGIADCMRSVLMNRATIRSSRHAPADETREQRMDRWRFALEDREMLGRRVSGAIKDKWASLRIAVSNAEREVKRYERFREVLSKHGFDPDASDWQFKNEIDRRLGVGLETLTQRGVNSLRRELLIMEDLLAEIRSKNEAAGVEA